MKNTLLNLSGILLLLTFLSCNHRETDTDWKFKVVSQKPSGSQLIIVDKNENPVKFDDEVDYSEYDIVKYAFYAKRVYARANDHDADGRYYFDNYKLVNQNINNVFNLPVKTEIQNEAVKEMFNKIFFDSKEYEVHNKDKKYGLQSFIVSKDGQIDMNNIYDVHNHMVSFERNKDGNIQIYWIP